MPRSEGRLQHPPDSMESNGRRGRASPSSPHKCRPTISDAAMSALCPDVLELILKKLPIETRLALRVRPNRVTPSDTVAKTVARMARIAAHPNHLCWVLARVEGHDKPVKLSSFMEMCIDSHSPTGEYMPRYFYATPCKTMRLRTSDHVFSPFLYWDFMTAPLGENYGWHLDYLNEVEKHGKAC